MRENRNKLCFCFCKQKSAYEMRISDWSSDVCSSDLHYAQIGHRIPDPFGFGIEAGDALPRAGIFDIMFVVPDAHPRVQLIVDDICEIGRASCRERVCQYV